jgi:hypothetical protein
MTQAVQVLRSRIGGATLLSRFSASGISPLRLLAAALTPTLIGAAIFRRR